MTEQAVRTERQLGAALRRIRKQQGLSQGDLGARVNLRQGTISRLEAGEPVQLRTVLDILAALHLELVIRPRTGGGAGDIEDLF